MKESKKQHVVHCLCFRLVCIPCLWDMHMCLRGLAISGHTFCGRIKVSRDHTSPLIGNRTMKAAFWRCLGVIALIGCSSVAQANSVASKVFEVASPSVVIVLSNSRANSMQGSGVVFRSVDQIRLNGILYPSASFIATNAHVVGSEKSARVKAGVDEYLGEVISRDDELDLAIVKINNLTLPKAVLKEVAPVPKVGSSVFAIGNPLGLEKTLTSGLISSVRQKEGITILQTSAAISPGSSGGGLFNEQGELVGITTSKMVKGEALGFAVSANHLTELIDCSLAAAKIANIGKIEDWVYSGEDAKKLQDEADLARWLRKERTVENKPACAEVSKKIDESMDAFLLRKDMDTGKRLFDQVIALTNKYLAEGNLKPTASDRGVDGKPLLLLECVLKAGEREDRNIAKIDLNAGTVNGGPATITADEISWTRDNLKTTISRYSGAISTKTLVETRFFKAGGVVFAGKCTRLPDRLF
ncbi:serine protease [Herbaspirillum sp. HC18]|nr:serine protease [Herbaspirillum sp. HC18]